MKKLAIIIGMNFVSYEAIAENQGIEETNYSVSASVSDSDSGNRMSISGSVRLPIADFTGASISGRYTDFDGDNNYIDSSTNSFSLGVFVRDYDLGIINASYEYSRTESDSAFSNSNNSVDSLSIIAIYYYKGFDLGLGRSKAEPDSGNSLNISNASVSYYVNKNFNVGASVIRMDADDNVFFVSYQPNLFTNSASISASYQDSETNDTLSISLAYYFDTKVSLKERGRNY